jgi:hypothetical protein
VIKEQPRRQNEMARLAEIYQIIPQGKGSPLNKKKGVRILNK